MQRPRAPSTTPARSRTEPTSRSRSRSSAARASEQAQVSAICDETGDSQTEVRRLSSQIAKTGPQTFAVFLRFALVVRGAWPEEAAQAVALRAGHHVHVQVRHALR